MSGRYDLQAALIFDIILVYHMSVALGGRMSGFKGCVLLLKKEMEGLNRYLLEALRSDTCLILLTCIGNNTRCRASRGSRLPRCSAIVDLSPFTMK